MAEDSTPEKDPTSAGGESSSKKDSTIDPTQASGKDKSPSGSIKDKVDPKKAVADKATQAATSSLSEENQERVQKVQDTVTKAAAAKSAAASGLGAAKGFIGGLVAVFGNPVGWIALAIVIVLVLVLGLTQVLGRNQNADGCYGMGGESSKVDFSGDESDDWTERANEAGSWLLSQSFEFKDGGSLTKEQVAGIMGNFIAESNVTFAQAERKGENSDGSLDKMDNEKADSWTKGNDPRGLGIAQWTWNPGRAKDLIDVANDKGQNWYEPEPQLQLLTDEINDSYGAELVAAGFNDESKSAEDLAVIFHDVYEVSADDTMDNRKKAAKEFIEKFDGKVSGNTGGACVDNAGSNVDTSDVSELAISLSYPTTEESRVGPGDQNGKSQAKKEYIEAKEKAMKESSGPEEPMPDLYASCDRFVATVMRLTVDEEVPWGNTDTQREYFYDSSKWEKYDSKSEAEPGDVWVTNGHIIIYVGDVDGVDSIAHASIYSRVAGIGPSDYLDDGLVDTGGRSYDGFRFKG